MSELKRHLERYVANQDIKANPVKYSQLNLKKFKSLEGEKLADMLKMVIAQLGYDGYSITQSGDKYQWKGVTFQYEEVANDVLSLTAEKKDGVKTTLDEIHFTPHQFSSKQSGTTHEEINKESTNDIYKEHIILVYEFLK